MGRTTAVLFFSFALAACGDGMLLTVGRASPQHPTEGGLQPPRDAEAPEGSIITPCPECQSCPDGSATTISGTVYDPAGKVPLYNVIVYVPQSENVEAPSDGLTCDTCAGTVVKPVAAALSRSDGRFLLEGRIPTGKDVPLVIQIGKWQRKVHLPEVVACQDNRVTDPELTRLPRNTGEGHLPQMALTTGHSDALECLLRRIGIDDQEFTTDAGRGRVHMFVGCNGDMGLPANQFSPALGGAQFAAATTLWSSAAKLMQYDMLVLSCEGSQCESEKAMYVDGMKKYADNGGRLFLDHTHFYWLRNGPAPWPDTAEYIGPNGKDLPSPFTGKVDSSFPKGKAFADWLVNTQASTTPGSIDIWGAQFSVRKTNPPSTQQWIFTDQNPRDPSGLAVEYMTMNTPVELASIDPDGGPDASDGGGVQCGRVVYTDLHVVGANATDAGAGVGTKDVSHADTPFPNGCVAGDLTAQEKALEFMFFDLSSCIQKDTDLPVPPPPLR